MCFSVTLKCSFLMMNMMCMKMLPLKFVFAAVVTMMMMMSENVNSYLMSSGPHIADVNLLLPPKMTYPVEYRLQGSDGCFKWTWDHHDLLSLVPEYNISSHCSTSAQLSSIAPYSGRKETAVYATDVHTGHVIRCKVYIDNFSRIQIFHSSIKLDLDGLATLRVRAFDAEDNVFSSLVGLQFMWKLIPEADRLLHHLVHVPLKDSPLSDCGGLCGDLNIQRKLEDNGVFSDLYVVKGTEIGHEVVSVHLLEPQFEHLGDRIILTVAEAMSLDPPSPVVVLIGAVFGYYLKIIHGNIPQAVTLPSPNHKWSIENTSVADVDSATGVVHALTLGASTVKVEDTRVDGHMQMSTLCVALPDLLSLYILPLAPNGDPVEMVNAGTSVSHWYVVCGRQYLIQMKVFSQGHCLQEMFITESDDLKLQSDQSAYWKTLLVSSDTVTKSDWRNSRILSATSQGQGKLTASLTYFSGYLERKEVLKVIQEVMVCEQVKFSFDRRATVSGSPLILLPWVPGVYQEAELKATGGCAKTSSDYKWFSSDMATVSISASGVVQAKKPGKVTVKAVSVFDLLNHDEVVIEVSIPASMVMLQNFPVETVVGSHIQAAATMKTSSGAYFYRCDFFSTLTRWIIESESFIIVNATGGNSFSGTLKDSTVNSSIYGPPCAWTYIYASGSGRASLHATISKERSLYGHAPHEPIILQASLDIAAYSPLIVCQLGDGSQFGGYWFDLSRAESHNQLETLDLYLAPGTHLDVMLIGGPEQWGNDVEFVETVDIFTQDHSTLENAVLVQQVSDSYISVYKVICQKLGTYRLLFKRGNLVGDDHPLPATEEAVLSLECSFPSSIVLLADKQVNELDVISDSAQADRSPERIRTNPITVANGRIIRMAAVGISASGKSFANSSSLSLSWELSNCEGLALWNDDHNLSRTKSSWERFLALQNHSGVCTVRATTAAFHPLQSLENVLTDAIRLQLVSTLRVEPEYGLIYFHSNAKLNLSIAGGSCFLDAAVNDSRVAEVFLQPSILWLDCSQVIVAPKGLGTVLVTVSDIGTTPSLVASSTVRVADVDWIKIISPGEISLMEGTSRSFDVIAGVHDGTTFDASQYVYMNIHVHIQDHIAELMSDENLSNAINMPKFSIMARHLGVTTLYVSATQQSGLEIVSQIIRVEVYAPPKVHPGDIFLAPGASYLFAVKEGPRIGVSIEYSSSDDGIATVHKLSGLVNAISPGNTAILAKVYTEGDMVLCQAYGRVEVGVPSLVTLTVQSEQIDIDRVMPIYPSLPKGDLFSFYQVCRNYKWTIGDEEVLSFHVAVDMHDDKSVVLSAPSKDSYVDDEYPGFIVDLYGRSAGRTDVSLSFSCDFKSASYSRSRSYNASIMLVVVPDLPLALGASMTWILPPHYTTTNLLPTVSESHDQKDSQSRKDVISYSVLRTCGGTDGEMQTDSISIDGDRIRTAESSHIACIQAKDCKGGKIEIASCIRVAEVAQVRIKTTESLAHVIYLPVGTELEFAINFCDDLGNPFYEAHNVAPFAAETNFHNLISIHASNNGNSKTYLKAMGQGRALVRVSIDNNVQKSDYVLVKVASRLSPQSPIVQLENNLNSSGEGSIVRPDLRTDQTVKGSNEQVLTVLDGNTVIVNPPKKSLSKVDNPSRTRLIGMIAFATFFSILLAGFYLYGKQMCRPPPLAQPPIPPTSPLPTQSERSPGTPTKGFAEYVYRTLDETPNYTTRTRRRFNPQNSY